MRVNEIFYSLQGEGHFTGTPAVFLRLAGCNLNCWFCDTEFNDFTDMSEEDIVHEVSKFPSRYIVITGGEPTLQLTASLTQALHSAGFYIMMETNGTRALPSGCKVNWITCSPKRSNASTEQLAAIRIEHIDELKVVYEGPLHDMSVYDNIQATEYRLQPCSTDDDARNQSILNATIQYVQENPKWKLSLQTHKILGVR